MWQFSRDQTERALYDSVVRKTAISQVFCHNISDAVGNVAHVTMETTDGLSSDASFDDLEWPRGSNSRNAPLDWNRPTPANIFAIFFYNTTTIWYKWVLVNSADSEILHVEK